MGIGQPKQQLHPIAPSVLYIVWMEESSDLLIHGQHKYQSRWAAPGAEGSASLKTICNKGTVGLQTQFHLFSSGHSIVTGSHSNIYLKKEP